LRDEIRNETAPPNLADRRLGQYFKGHDTSSHTSSGLPLLLDLHDALVNSRFKHQKSIRMVVDDDKRRVKSRTSAMTASNMENKRGSGSKPEAITA
jgi:hypothetical protein